MRNRKQIKSMAVLVVWCFREITWIETENMSGMSNIAKNAWLFDHRIDFDNSSVIGTGSFRIRKTLVAWHTSATMLTIIQSRFLTSIAFFLNNSYLIYTSILCFRNSFYNFLLFSFRLFCIYFVIPRFIFIRRRL